MRDAVDIIVVICVIVGAYALLTLVGAFPATTLPLVIGAGGAFGGYLYGRFGRRRSGVG